MSLGLDVNDWFEYGIDRRSRTLYYGSVIHDEEFLSEGGTDYKSVGNLIKGLHLLERTSDSPITIWINNPGGNEYHMFAAYDAIRRCKSPVTTIVTGHAMSAASVIAQAGDHRVILPHAYYMLHYGCWYFDGHTKDFHKSSDHAKQLDRMMEDIYLEQINKKHPEFTRRMLFNKIQFDCYLNAEETVELGLADEIEWST